MQWCSQPKNLIERQPNFTQKFQISKYQANLISTVTRLKPQNMGCKSFLQISGYGVMVFISTSQIQRFNTSQPTFCYRGRLLVSFREVSGAHDSNRQGRKSEASSQHESTSLPRTKKFSLAAGRTTLSPKPSWNANSAFLTTTGYITGYTA